MPEHDINRRNFVKSTAIIGSSLLIANPKHVKGSQANSNIEVGVIGLGGRGSLIAGFLQEHGGYRITAVADYFQNVAIKLVINLMWIPNGAIRVCSAINASSTVESMPYFWKHRRMPFRITWNMPWIRVVTFI